jgi:hypothetical protein
MLNQPGIEPGSQAWKAYILTVGLPILLSDKRGRHATYKLGIKSMEFLSVILYSMCHLCTLIGHQSKSAQDMDPSLCSCLALAHSRKASLLHGARLQTAPVGPEFQHYN